MEPNNVLGFICLIFLLYRFIIIYSAGTNLVVPYYIVIYGIFTFYTALSNIFIANKLQEVGLLKFLYSNPFILTLMAFLVVENTHFPPRWIRLATWVLGLTLITAAVVSLVQIFDPLFFRKSDSFISGLTYERMKDFYGNNQGIETGEVSRFLMGYRASIYSFVDPISVGMDGIAIFSLLLALKTGSRLKSLIWVFAAALISFLSSSRWIMVNFLVVASQNIWIKKNIVWNAFKYAFYFIGLLMVLVPVAEFAGIDIHKFTKERLMSNDASTRILAFTVFSKVFPDHPIIGTGGADTSKMTHLLKGRSSQIHVGYLKLFYYYGLVGGLIFLTFLVSLLLRMWKMARESHYWGGFFAILAFFVANFTLVQFSLFYTGLLLAIIFSNHFYAESTKVLISSQNYNTINTTKSKNLKLPQY